MSNPDRVGRRRLVSGALALSLAACGRKSDGQVLAPSPRDAPPLKTVAGFPVGCAVSTPRLADPINARLIARDFSQVTAEWEMKMEYILRDDGGFRFDAPDAIASFARAEGLRLFGHTLIWYYQKPEAFTRLDGQGAAFAQAYRNYILAVAGRYRGQAVAWDVVNEAVAEDGAGLRECLWSRNLGQLDYMRRAFDHAHEADPEALLLINDYNLESLPAKRATFLKLVEDLLRTGAPVGGIGTQTHIAADLAPSAIADCFRDLAGLGLPIHVSELDISLNEASAPFASREDLTSRQARLGEAVAQTLADLPSAQRFAFTVWGLRDKESWLRTSEKNPHPPWDAPLLFDDRGQPKPLYAAVARGLTGR